MDTKLGTFGLSRNQIGRLNSLHSVNVRGFKVASDGSVTVTTIDPLDAAEMQALSDSVNSLSSDPLPLTRLEELGRKPVLTLPEVTEALKLAGILK